MPNSAHNPWSPQQIGLRLARYRLAMGRSSASICAELNIAPSKWSNWESGRNNVSIGEGIALAEKLGISLDYIYRGKDDFGIAADVAPKLRRITMDMVLKDKRQPKLGRPRKARPKQDAAD